MQEVETKSEVKKNESTDDNLNPVCKENTQDEKQKNLLAIEQPKPQMRHKTYNRNNDSKKSESSEEDKNGHPNP